MDVWGFPILVKFDASGNVLYANNASDNTDNAGLRVAYSNGVIGLIGQYAGGNFDWGGISLGPNNEYYDNFLARFDAATGNILTIDTIPSGPMANEYPTVLTTDKLGNFYAGGEYDNNIIIAGNTYSKQDGYTDGYIAKYANGSCNCIAPLSAFTRTGTALTYTFTYSGTTPIDSVVWAFGDNQSASGLTVSHTFSLPDTFQ